MSKNKWHGFYYCLPEVLSVDAVKEFAKFFWRRGWRPMPCKVVSRTLIAPHMCTMLLLEITWQKSTWK